MKLNEMKENSISMISSIACMYNNKEAILDVLKNNLSKVEYQAVVDGFNKLHVALQKLTSALGESTYRGTMYQNALTSKKIDPYVAGGLANGIAGVGAGISAASSAANRNASIDAARTVGRIQTRQANRNLEKAEQELLNVYYLNVKNYVYSVPTAKQIHIDACEEALRKEKAKPKYSKEYIRTVVIIAIIASVLAIFVVMGNLRI